MNNKKLEEMAETIVTEKISYGGLEYSLAGKIHKDCVKSCILGMKAALNLPEVKAAFEALKSCEVNGAGVTNMRVKQALADLKKAGLV